MSELCEVEQYRLICFVAHKGTFKHVMIIELRYMKMQLSTWRPRFTLLYNHFVANKSYVLLLGVYFMLIAPRQIE